MLIPTDAPPGFAAALEAGDLACQDGQLAAAASAWAAARRALDPEETSPSGMGCVTLCNLRLELLLALCLEPALVSERAGDPSARWEALHEVARSGVLAFCFPTAVTHLASLLRPSEGEFPGVVARSRRAWGVLMACDNLVTPAIGCIDGFLVAAGMHRQRAELARHPSADADAWLDMLTRCRTPDLVQTLWEMPQAMEDERVREAVGAPAGPEAEDAPGGEG
jgi:hypothetical protein